MCNGESWPLSPRATRACARKGEGKHDDKSQVKGRAMLDWIVGVDRILTMVTLDHPIIVS